MKKILLFYFLFLAFFSFAIDSMNFHASMNGWSDNVMSYTDTGGARYFKVTVQATVTENDSAFLLHEDSAWDHKWNNVYDKTVDAVFNIIHSGNGGNDATIDGIVSSKFYSVVWKDNGYNNTDIIIMETSEQPETITDVSLSNTLGRCALTGTPIYVKVTLSGNKCAEEKVIIRYTTNRWASSTFIEASTGAGAEWLAQLPGMSTNATVEFYALMTTLSASSSDLANYPDLCSINFNNNNGENYFCYYFSELTAYLVGDHSSWTLTESNKMKPKLVGGGNSNFWGITLSSCALDGEFKLTFGQDWLVQWGNDGAAGNDYWVNNPDVRLNPPAPIVENNNNLIWKFTPSNYMHVTCYEPHQASNALNIGVMALSEIPADITNTTDDATNQRKQNNFPVNIDIFLNKSLCPQERIFVRYTSNDWASSYFSEASGSALNYSATIPGMSFVTCEYYVLTTTLTNGHPDLVNHTDLMTINYDVNNMDNYEVIFVPEPLFLSFIIFYLYLLSQIKKFRI